MTRFRCVRVQFLPFRDYSHLKYLQTHGELIYANIQFL